MMLINWTEGKTTNTLKRNTEALLCVSKKGGVDVNADNTKYIFTSRPQNTKQNHNTETSNTVDYLKM
jgi:hypothetical protein